MVRWKKSHSYKVSWNELKQFEINGWRLPTKDELENALNNNVRGFYSDVYWTSETFAIPKIKWVVCFNTGRVFYTGISSNYYFRLCR